MIQFVKFVCALQFELNSNNSLHIKPDACILLDPRSIEGESTHGVKRKDLLKDLKQEFVGGNNTGFLVGKDVWDKDQGQNFQGRYKFIDAQALPFARPDQNLEESRKMTAFDPVGNGNGGGGGNFIINGTIGSVTIVTS